MHSSLDRRDSREYVPAPFVAAFEIMALVLLVYAVLLYLHKIAFTRASWLVGERVAAMGGSGLLAASVLCFICFVGLSNGQRWARWLAVLLLAAMAFEQIPSISAAVMEFRWKALALHAVVFFYAVVLSFQFWPKAKISEKPLDL